MSELNTALLSSFVALLFFVLGRESAARKYEKKLAEYVSKESCQGNHRVIEDIREDIATVKQSIRTSFAMHRALVAYMPGLTEERREKILNTTAEG